MDDKLRTKAIEAQDRSSAGWKTWGAQFGWVLFGTSGAGGGAGTAWHAYFYPSEKAKVAITISADIRASMDYAMQKHADAMRDSPEARTAVAATVVAAFGMFLDDKRAVNSATVGMTSDKHGDFSVIIQRANGQTPGELLHAARDRVRLLEGVVSACGIQFRSYEANHKEKAGVSDHDHTVNMLLKKAETNSKFAKMCEDALAQIAGA